jgi:hypothetical protein
MRAYFLVLSVLLPALVFADMIPDYPPIQCPAGSYESQSHNGPYCSPSSCKTDSNCQNGATCQSQGLCIISTKQYGRGGEYTQKSAGEVCNAQKACSSGTCEVVKRCISKEAPATKEPEVIVTPPVTTPENNPTPESQPDSVPESTPSATPTTPPTKVTPKGRCSVSPAENFSPSLLVLCLGFFLVLRRRSLARQ